MSLTHSKSGPFFSPSVHRHRLKAGIAILVVPLSQSRETLIFLEEKSQWRKEWMKNVTFFPCEICSCSRLLHNTHDGLTLKERVCFSSSSSHPWILSSMSCFLSSCDFLCKMWWREGIKSRSLDRHTIIRNKRNERQSFWTEENRYEISLNSLSYVVLLMQHQRLTVLSSLWVESSSLHHPLHSVWFSHLFHMNSSSLSTWKSPQREEQVHYFYVSLSKERFKNPWIRVRDWARDTLWVREGSQATFLQENRLSCNLIIFFFFCKFTL
jgi:hypothetical protein